MSKNPSATLRALRPDDKPQWASSWRDYLAFYEATRPPEIYDLYFDRLIGTDPQDFNALVAEVDGKLVGLAHYLFHRHGWSEENTCYLQDLYTAPQARGRGLGRALIEAVYADADAAGVPSVYWLTQDFNTQARHLYDRIGAKTPFIKYARK